MGEVRVKVRLTNAADESLARRGQLQPAGVRSITVEAVVDTGAVRCVIPNGVPIPDKVALPGTHEDFTIVFAGRYAPPKRQDTLLRAVALLPQNLKDWILRH